MAGLSTQVLASKAINFSFTDSKGKSIQLSDYRGKWVLVNFWAPWCPRCKMDFPNLNDLDARSDFVVIGVVMDYGIDQNSAISTAQRYNLRFPNVLGGNRRDPSNPSQQVGPVDFYPTSYLYAPDGEIVMFIPGIVSKQKVIAFTEQYNQANPTAFAQTTPPVPVAATPAKPGVNRASMSKTSGSAAGDKKKMSMY